MTSREKKLTAAVTLLVLLWGGNWARQRYSDWHQRATTAQMNARQQWQDAKTAQAMAQSTVKKLGEWREKSLPSSVNVAQSQYRAWLIEQLQQAQLQVKDITPSSTGRRPGDHRNLTYAIDAEGDLEAVVRFLDCFYRSDQMHKISSLRLTPKETGSDLRVDLTIEALVIDGAKRENGLSEAVSHRLALASADEYVASVVGRDFFDEYTPPKPPPKVVETVVHEEPPKPKFDDSKHAYLTGVVTAGDQLEAWIHVRTEDDEELSKLTFIQGDELKVGLFEGTVVEVRQQELLIQTAEGLLAIRIGKTLREGKIITSNAGT